MDVISRINESVKQCPDGIAIIDKEQNINYRQMQEMIYKIVLYLQNSHIGKEDIVGVCMNRSYLSICTILAILQSGAAFLPIDSKNPIDRIKYMLDQAKAKVVFIDGDMPADINGVDINKIITEKEVSNIQKSTIMDDDLAYVIFTSGSTGMPKGVMIEHGGMMNHIVEKIRLLSLDNNCTVAYNASIGFDISIWQILAPLCVGGKIVVISDELVLNIRKFIKVLQKHKVTVLEVVPIYLELIIEECKKKNRLLDSLKFVISTGEELSKIIAERWFECFSNIPLINAYGPTEASDDIMHYIINKNNLPEKIPIGKKINNINVFIKNDMLEDCDINEVGELWVSGICVARGYIRNEEETKKYFSVDKKTGERLFKTGDLVLKDKSDNFIYYGRYDTQIKLNGNRIELQEIEDKIMSYNGVKNAKVIFMNQEKKLIGLFTSDIKINVVYLKEYLQRQIPNYMLPAVIIQIDKIPTNINGKVDVNKILRTNIVLGEKNKYAKE